MGREVGPYLLFSLLKLSRFYTLFAPVTVCYTQSMGRIAVCICALMLLLALLYGCDVPAPPPELSTPIPGSSQNPEGDAGRTPVRPTVERELTPLPTGPGHIYFVRGSGLWRIAPDGTGETQLSDLLPGSPPQPSPDGKWVAFISGRDLYVIPSSGGQARKLASGDMALGQRAGWNSDSALIGYITYDLSTYGREQAWAVPVGGSDPLLITSITYGALGRGPTYEHSVQWSPDDKWVAVGGASSPFRLLRWPLSTGRAGDVRDLPGGEPEWSPDSRTLLFTESLNGALSLYDVLKDKAEPFVNEQARVGTGLGEYTNGPRPRFSPASSGADSDPIAYCSRSPQGEPRVAIRRRGSRELPPLSALTNNPIWSPSGDRLVVETGQLQDDPLGPRWIPTGLALANISPSGEHTMAPLVRDGRSPVWGK